MRILHIAHQYLPEKVGGVELYTRWVTQALSRRGHQVAIFYRRSAPGSGLAARTDEADVRIWAVWDGPLTPVGRFLATWRAPLVRRHFEHVLDAFAPDLIHVEHLMGLPAALIHFVRQRGIPYVITLWDFWWVCANAQLLTNDRHLICDGPRLYLNCARCALARAEHEALWPALPPLAVLLADRNRRLRRILMGAEQLIAPTEFVRRWYAAHRIPEERLLTLPPGLTYPAIPRRERGGGEPLRFAYIGGLSWQKGVHVLVEALGGLPGCELWIAGDESADPAYVARLKAAASPNIRFLGRLTREQVWATLAQVDVVVVPTLWYETFSIIVSEAFAAGCPVLASRLGPLVDRVRDGVDGLLLPPGDVQAWRAAAWRLLTEPALLRRLRANVRPPLTLEEHAERLEATYRRLIR